jgi:hypothetical protein
MKVQVSESTPLQLDWMVAKAEGFNAEALVELAKRVPGKDYGCFLTKYSTDWSQGGPIIEREQLRLNTNVSGGWTAQKKLWTDDGTASGQIRWFNGSGPTPLIAAMRCLVASKLSYEVDIPEKLL